MPRQPKTQPALVAYVGNALAPFSSQHALTDFHGHRIGVCRSTSTWRTYNSYVGTRMYQIYATVNGVEYTGRGRGFGDGMSVALRPCAVKADRCGSRS